MKIRGAYGTKKAQTGPKTFGERLRSVRMAWGWSQQHLAGVLGTNQRLISHWERDVAYPSSAAMTSLSSILGISPKALLSGEGFTVPEMPVLPEGVAKESVAQYTALSRLLPKPQKDGVTFVDLNAFESKPLILNDAVKVLKERAGAGCEIWVVVRSRKDSGNDPAVQG